MNFLFRKLFRKHVKPEQEGEFLIKVVCGSAHQVFLDEGFRKLVDFEKQSQTEQDRIFNELTVTALILLIFILDDLLSHLQTERFHFWKEVRAKAADLYVEWLKSLGIAGSFVEIWKKLIDLRLEEYQEESKRVSCLWQEEFKKEDSEKLQDMAVRVETLTVGSMIHITRGKAQPQDPLRRHLRTWVSVLDSKLQKRVGW